MKILALADSAVEVPPAGYGGTERILSYLIEELHMRGHEITLIGKEGSRPPGRLLTFDDARGRTKAARAAAKVRYRRLLKKQLRSHDIVHSVARLDYALPAISAPIPKVLHFENPILPEHVRYIRGHQRGRLVIAPAGRRMMEGVRDNLGPWRQVHNAIPVSSYRFQGTPDEPPYLAFLGRLTRAKGVDDAISASLAAGFRLRIGGNVPAVQEDERFFQEELRPRIAAGEVEYLGELNDRDKQGLLGGATALLNPIKWEEPFGIVAIESMACGTPVLSYARGELPNILREGVTGYLCDDLEELIRAIARVPQLSRAQCRRDVESRFDVPVMTDAFEEIYEWLVSDYPPPGEWA